MKNIFVAASLLITTAGFSQSVPEDVTPSAATVSSTFCVELNTGEAVTEWYVMNIADLGFTNQEDAQKAFWTRANNLITYIVDHSQNKAFIHLHLDRTPVPQDLTWWNNYLATLCPAE